MSKDDFPIGATPPRARIALEEKLGHVFARPELLDLALTHSSWANEYSGGQHHNERQEFLGDAVLELCVSWELFRRFPEAREGELTKLRARLVSTVSLAERAREFGLDSLLKLGKGEERQGGRSRDSVLSDVLEAVLAAVYEDGGFTAAQAAVAHIFAPHWPRAAGEPQRKDYKTRLQEVAQQLFRERPVYVQLASHGPEHAKIFEVSLHLPDGREFTASGTSCKKDEQEAARQALNSLEHAEENPDARPFLTP